MLVAITLLFQLVVRVALSGGRIYSTNNYYKKSTLEYYYLLKMC